eukprot:4097763-Heterocapsa_arctica.AAC.1
MDYTLIDSDSQSTATTDSHDTQGNSFKDTRSTPLDNTTTTPTPTQDGAHHHRAHPTPKHDAHHHKPDNQPPGDHQDDWRHYTGQEEGSVIFFRREAGWGYIIHQTTCKDIWFHISHCTDHKTPLDDDKLRFDTQPSRKRPGTLNAVNITGGTGPAQRPPTTNQP